jgi:GT2 family glycosyltransferase
MIHGRNILRQAVLDKKYDYFLSLEQDIIPPPRIIEELLTTQKDIIGGAFYNKTKERTLTIMAGTFAEGKNDQSMVQSMGFLQLFPTRIQEVAYIGLGCTLIAKKVLERITFRYDSQHDASDDIYFCLDARREGFIPHLHTGMLCAHRFDDAFKRTPY